MTGEKRILWYMTSATMMPQNSCLKDVTMKAYKDRQYPWRADLKLHPRILLRSVLIRFPVATPQ